MTRVSRQLIFDGLVTVAIGLLVAAYLDVLLVPIYAVAGFSILVVFFGVYVVAPRRERRQAGLLVLIYGGLAGVVVPWSATQVQTLPVDQTRLVVGVSFVILMLLFVHLRVTVFRSQDSTRSSRHRV